MADRAGEQNSEGSDSANNQEVLQRAKAAFGRKEFDSAARDIQHFLSANSGSSSLYTLLGTALLKSNELEAATTAFEQALVLDPSNIDALTGRAVGLRAAGAPGAAAKLFEKVLNLQPESVVCRIELAKALIELDHADDAKAVLDKLTTAARESSNVDILYSEIFAIKGDHDIACSFIYQALERSPGNSAALLVLSKLAPQSEMLSLPETKARLTDPKCALEERRNLGFAIGRAEEARENYDAAFQAYKTGNDAQDMLSNVAVGAYSRESHERYVINKIQVYRHDRVSALSQFGSEDCRPIFIVGMPRSGTTLVEQIISSHPEVFGAGERRTLATACDYFEKAAVIEENLLDSSLPPAFFRRAANLYLANLDIGATGYTNFTDKNPHNFFLVGLIRILFPRARIIHCRRNGLDTCVSNYFQIFSFQHNYCNRLEDLSHYFGQYVGLFEHWMGYEKDDIIEVDYEDIIQQPEHCIRKLLEQCELDWSDQCLAFHKNERPIYTPSKLQVRKPLYHSSIGRWRHYKKDLSALLTGPDAVLFERDTF